MAGHPNCRCVWVPALPAMKLRKANLFLLRKLKQKWSPFTWSPESLRTEMNRVLGVSEISNYSSDRVDQQI